MNLINAPRIVQSALSLLGPVASLFPKTIMNLRYRRWTGRFIDWNHPANLQENILAGMMAVRKDSGKLKFYAMLADKVGVRDYVSAKVGDGSLTKLFGVWKRPEDIDFDKLPIPCVIKTNNGCGTNIIVRKSADMNPEKIRRQLKSWLRYPYGQLSGQPHYSKIAPKILCEEYLEQVPGSDELPYDYKFFCFNGKPEFILYYNGRKLNSHKTYNLAFDTDWNVIEGAVRNPSPEVAPRPEAFEKMLSMAATLSEGIQFVRVDFYAIGSRVVFGEMTLTPDVVMNFTPEFLSRWNP